MSAGVPDAALQRRFRRALGDGFALPSRLREWLERGVGAGLGPLRVHTGAEADRLAAALGADAVTVGADVFFRAGRYAPERRAGRALLVHEVAHAVQQAALGRRLVPAPEWELAADLVAEALVDGQAGAARPVGAVRRLRDDEPLVAQCHASWEHHLLGDARPADLAAIAKSKTASVAQLKQLADFYLMWSKDPEAVSEDQIHKKFPYIRTLRLQTSRLLVTYGELNTLPDYLAGPAVMDDQPAGVLLPILQAVRQDGYAKIRALLKQGGGVPFKHADKVSIGTGCKMFDQLYQLRKLDDLTKHLGTNGTDHYTALLARNACHFAPFTWHRWDAWHTIARSLAGKAYGATDANEKAKYTHQAWLHNAYADHFLQDSFASGHLINKTLVMQWFVEWAGEQTLVKVTDWPQIMRMSSMRQPGLSAPHLYDPAKPVTSADPQTAEEQDTRDARMRMSGVAADLLVDQEEAYRDYLAFLNSTVVQSSSAALHDHYSTQSLWVSSVADTAPYEVWGDDTMLTGGDGVKVAAETAQMSRQALHELIGGGKTSITTQQIKNRFPTKVGKAGQTRTLPEWHTDIRQKVLNDIFPKIHYNVLLATPHIDKVSVDL